MKDWKSLLLLKLIEQTKIPLNLETIKCIK